MKTLLKRFRCESRGQDLIEYALLTGAISFAALAMIGNVGAALQLQYGNINQQVAAMGSGATGAAALTGGTSTASSSGDSSTASASSGSTSNPGGASTGGGVGRGNAGNGNNGNAGGGNNGNGRGNGS